MGVDFDSCEDCGDYTCDQNIFYLDLEGYGRHKTCSVCVKEHFEELDPRENTDICIEVLEDEVDEAFQTTFYAVRVEDVPDKEWGDSVSNDKILKTTKSASEAKEWCVEDESIRVGFTQPWDVVKEDENLARLAIPPAFGGGGVAAEDFDNDGWVDLLLLGGRGNQLLKNKNGEQLVDITHQAGVDYKRSDGKYGEPRQPIIVDFDAGNYHIASIPPSKKI